MDYRAGMFVFAMAFLLGIVFVQQLAVLPGLHALVLMLAYVCLGLLIYAITVRRIEHDLIKQITLIISIIILIILGIIYASCFAKQLLSYRLPESLIGQNTIISGTVSSIPVVDDKVSRFEFDVDKHRLLSDTGYHDSELFPKKIRLSWYYGQPVNAGERWQFEVRLKPPHGFMNPGAFDYEAWLFQHGIDATGYVRESDMNMREQAFSATVDTIRQGISRQIDALAEKQETDRFATGGIGSFALIKALAIGDKSAISNHQWRVLATTGTSHLMAISGLHIGLASLFAYLLIRYTVPATVIKRIPAQHVALVAGLFSAFLYALIAGLSVPTQRAIIMLSVLSVMLLLRRNHRPFDALGFALICVLLVDPLAVLSAGFWFSFSAVAVIFISLDSPSLGLLEDQSVVKTGAGIRVLSILKRWVRLQLLISLFLLPLSLFMFQQVSLVSPLANLLLIPYVSFLVVPVVLLAIILLFILPFVSYGLFNIAAYLLDIVWPLLSYLAAMPYSSWVRGDVGFIELITATVLMLLLFYSNRISCYLFRHIKPQLQPYACWLIRSVLCLLFVPLMVSGKPVLNTGEYQLSVLDVGQGSAAVIQTQHHVAVFDAGAKFSDRLNAGSGVVIPYLRSQGISRLDYLVISHGDADHIGGAPAILDEFPEATVLGQDIEKLHAMNKQPCIAGFQWRWDGVDFVFLSPAEGDVLLPDEAKRNNHSCVLRVSSTSGSVLFTGDIESRIEQKLLDRYGKKLSSDILLVPHHGSNTSSNAAFINAVNPQISIISAGYKNRYRLPSDKVIQRYEAGHRKWIQTDKSGAITIKLNAEPGLVVDKYRLRAGKYWHHISP
jgi:competence protein ComEC